ncbi:DUF1972 domain-containing protein [Flammeovirga yaeyamensis]|uniref:DUF1972 domain-containing protein n=1 Tax=Flammeovirga yaeyamensis TaxID=367791 RepID=A0AAX1N4C9_9BACT|nr:DUF1972 domain-containing protein [Flammeovirga yaeyamensis]MBB3699818.1 hypothetical protein [Flammeovirga yaeyamensis]NMF36613.1 glycosyltransferase family 1 protein [Flammeovirga yaeyamensis]QWG02340.1 DUF1972 domain-containing protein [Flammeovirga yaeyamensis]
MKIAILGTRGVPNNHGGFEQFAEYLSKYLVDKGHETYVYNSHDHPYQNSEWNGVKILHKYDPEFKIGTAGQFIYDFNCVKDARNRNFDIILQLGYTSSSIWGWYLPKKSVIITNMDGLEWRRSKYSPKVRRFLKYAEKLAINTSDYLVSDSVGIQEYIHEKYQKKSKYIAYGANLFQNPNSIILKEYSVEECCYNMLIARLEPENSIEVILDGVNDSNSKYPFLVVGKHNTVYGEYLKDKYKSDERIKFLGGIYNIDALNNLRYYSNIYFHGHTVGGTNPSLLEAMASNSLICANNNIFNKAILKSEALYFNNSNDVKVILENTNKSDYQDILEINCNKIINEFDWDIINKHYLDYMEDCFKKGK